MIACSTSGGWVFKVTEPLQEDHISVKPSPEVGETARERSAPERVMAER